MVGGEQSHLVDAYLRGFLKEPLRALVELGRSDGDFKLEAPVVIPFALVCQVDGGPFRQGLHQLGVEEAAFTVGDAETLALGHAQHFDAVLRLVLGEGC